jgi:hypothetical protein
VTEPENVNPRAIGIVALATIAIIGALGLLARTLVVPAAPAHALPPSPIEHALFVPRALPGPRLPIARAIEAVLADPTLIGGHR